MTPQSRAERQSRPDRNVVHLAGRVSGAPVERELPSGDRVVTFRVVVARPAGTGRGDAPGGARGARARADTLEVACWSARTRASAVRLPDGQQVEVEGMLRRRFYRTPAGAASRYEVHARRLRRL